MSLNKKTWLWIIVLIILAGVVLFWFYLTNRPTVVSSDLSLTGDRMIAKDAYVVLKNGASLNVDGSLAIEGKLACANGPLNINVTGKLLVSGEIDCDRDDEIAEDDVGNGIVMVVGKAIEFTDNALVVSNGHIQIVDDKTLLATSSEQIDAIYDDAAYDGGDGLRIGPFIPIESVAMKDVLSPTGTEKTSRTSQRSAFAEFLIPTAHASDPPVEPARDDMDFPVEDTVKIGGTWVMGRGGNPPGTITVANPPKGIHRIILYYNFQSGRSVYLNNLTIFGPAGLRGTDDSGASCNAVGSDGKDAMRFNAQVKDMVINNFTINLGDGGQGGEAITKEDCDPAVAVGGDGGGAGNIKMVSSGSFKIVGAMQVNPGAGGAGGVAQAYGKKGDDGCPGKDGARATATGGDGGDNKKGLKVVNVEGVENIQIGDIVGGDGGDAAAFGGDGGDGNDKACDGGRGGDANATGGDGGDTASRTAQSFGGAGGDADPYPGVGGNGGKGDAANPGGNGGRGGDGSGAVGSGGDGVTARGQDGSWSNEDGAPGGDGGDGCFPGLGGAGGQHINPGVDGIDGENLCPPGTKPPFTTWPMELRLSHTIGRSSCPDSFDNPLTVSGPEGGSWRLDSSTLPGWLNMPLSGTFETETVELDLRFNCGIRDFSAHTESGRVKVTGFDADGTTLGESFFDVFVDLSLP